MCPRLSLRHYRSVILNGNTIGNTCHIRGKVCLLGFIFKHSCISGGRRSRHKGKLACLPIPLHLKQCRLRDTASENEIAQTVYDRLSLIIFHPLKHMGMTANDYICPGIYILLSKRSLVVFRPFTALNAPVDIYQIGRASCRERV